MATLEEYVAQATNAYKPAQTAIQNQLNALSGNLATRKNEINTDYAQQEEGLNKQRNLASSNASMSAAMRGSAFGGQTDAAIDEYYRDTFTPALTTLNTNKANALRKAEQEIENQRVSLNSQLSNLESQANQQALQQYWAAIEAEKQRQAQLQAQREAQASQNAWYDRLMNQIKNQNQGSGVKNWDFGNGYSIQEGKNGQAVYLRNGQAVSAGSWLGNTIGGASPGASSVRWDLWNDIWKNGVKTQGVGSDTIDAINKARGQNMLTNYKYLF